jgi:arylsulfatase A-like enzyme
MQEHGVPVTFAYISDAHDDHATGLAAGPGQADYVAQLASYDDAFAKFFTRLQADGITEDNTLFVVTADEGDHFAGGPPSPAGCDGINVPCTYAKIGEIDTNITALLTALDPTLTTPFDIHFDMAPTFYVSGNPPAGSPLARQFERDAAQLTAVSPITGNTDTLMRYLADPVEMKMLHMITGDPQRTPTFVMFGNPDYYFQTFGTPAVQEGPAFAWNHGGVAPEINTTWLGMVGPGVQRRGVDDQTWSDHTDIRPTMLVLLGLTDDYAHDGRALAEVLHEDALPVALRNQRFQRLAQAYKQIQAPVGVLGLTTLDVSTKALVGDDASYAALEAALSNLTDQRDALAATIAGQLEAAEFGGQGLDENSVKSLVQQAQALIDQANSLRP